MIARLALGLALIAAPALAQPVDNTGIAPGGWGFAHWGMTRAEVDAASAGTAHAAVDADADDVDGDFKLGDFKFDVELAFDDDAKLTKVMLKPAFPDKECNALRSYLRDKLGAPTLQSDTGGKSIWWRDERHGNAVEFHSTDGKACALTYEPLSTLAIVSS